jgi:hypothetical protein
VPEGIGPALSHDLTVGLAGFGEKESVIDPVFGFVDVERDEAVYLSVLFPGTGSCG